MGEAKRQVVGVADDRRPEVGARGVDAANLNSESRLPFEVEADWVCHSLMEATSKASFWMVGDFCVAATIGIKSPDNVIALQKSSRPWRSFWIAHVEIPAGGAIALWEVS